MRVIQGAEEGRGGEGRGGEGRGYEKGARGRRGQYFVVNNSIVF